MSFLRSAMGGDATIGDVIVRARADTTQLKRGLSDATNHVQAEGKKWSAIANATKTAFLGITAGVVGFAVEGVMAAQKFNSSLANIYAMTGQTKEAMVGIRKSILDMSLTVPQSAKELGDAFYYIASAGIAAKDATEVLKVSAMAATAGQTDVQTVADGLTSVMNAYALSGDKASHVTDILTQTIISGKSEWGDLAKAIGPVSIYAKLAGLDIEQMGAAIASLTQVGYSAQGATDGLKGALRSLLAPTQQQWKTFKALGIEYNTNWLKTKGLIGTLKEFEKQIGKVVTVTVKNKDGTTNLNATMAATEKMNRGAFDRWKKLTGGAHGFMLAQVLLNNEGKTYNGILKEMYAAQGKTLETFEKTRELDMGVQFGIMKNVFQKWAIELGTQVIPLLQSFVGVLTVNVPQAFESIAKVLNDTILPAVGSMVNAFGAMFTAVATALFGPKGMGAPSTLSPLQMFADVVAQIATMLTAVATVMTGLASNPVVGMFMKLAMYATGIAVAFKTISSLSGSLNRISAGFLSMITGGRLGKTGTTVGLTPESKALMGSATALDKSALALTEAAAVMKTAGSLGAEGLLAGGSLRQVGTPAMVGTFSTLGSPAAAAEKAAYLRTNTATQAYIRGLAQPMGAAERAMFAQSIDYSSKAFLKNTAQDFVQGLRSGVSTIGGLLRGGLGLVAKAFWPLMIADIATEFLKAPIGSFIETNTEFKRAGALIKKDFFGGLIEMVTKSWQGGDAAVGRAEETVIGTMKFKTLSLAKLGVTNATFDKLEAPVGTIDRAQGLLGLLGTLDLPNFAPAKQNINQYWQSVKGGLDKTVLEGASKFIWQTGEGGGRVDRAGTVKQGMQAKLLEFLGTKVDGQVSGLINQTREAFLDALRETLVARGFTAGQVAGMNISELDQIGVLVQQDTNGTLGFMQDFLVRKFTDGIQKAPPRVIDETKISRMTAKMTTEFGAHWESAVKDALKTPDTSKSKDVVAFMAKNFKDNWESLFADAVALAHPSIKDVNDKTIAVLANTLGAGWASMTQSALQAPKNKNNAPMVAYLAETLGKDWKKLLGDAITQGGALLRLGRGGPGESALQTALSASLQRLQSQTVAGIAEFWKGLPIAQQDVLFKYVNDAKSAISPEVQTLLGKKFEGDWMAALHAGTDSIKDGSVIAVELERVFGPTWRDAVKNFGNLLFQSQGGADSVALKKGLAAAISKQIAALTPQDLNAPDKTKTVNGKAFISAFTEPLTPAQQTKAQAAIQTIMDKVIKDGLLAAAASPSAESAKAGMAGLFKAFEKAIPDEKARGALLGQVVALERLSSIPTGKSAAEALSTVLPTISTWAEAAGNHLQNTLLPALKNLFNLNANGSSGSGSSGDALGTYRHRARGGPVWKDEPAWVGEYGKELFVPGTDGTILTNTVSKALASRSHATMAAKSPGQTVYVDRLQMFSQGDREQVGETFRWLSPGDR